MKRKKRILAVGSAGGHWLQLLRMAPAFSHHDVLWLSTQSGLSEKIPCGRFGAVRDASMWDKPGLLIMGMQVLLWVVRQRPDVVISTGAAPGFFAVMFGRVMGARTIWVDSIANAEELSLAGRKAKRWSHHWLTQWPELARSDGPHFIGAVL